MKAPIRISILKTIANAGRQGRTYHDVMELLRADYGRDKQFAAGQIQDHLQSMKIGGLIEIQETVPTTEEQDGYLNRYAITSYGMNRVQTYLAL